MRSYCVPLVICLISTAQRSFVGTVPIFQEKSTADNTQEEDTSVQELKDLKRLIVKQNDEVTDKMSEHMDTMYKAPDVMPINKIQTPLDMPLQGIYKNTVQFSPELSPINNNKRRTSYSNNIDILPEPTTSTEKISSFPTIQYSPLDMAEYVFWTGDEKGVTLAIEEFLREGLMTREEAITFLQEIKFRLEYLKDHYTQLGLNSRLKNQDTITKHFDYKQNKFYEKPELQDNFNINQHRQEPNQKRFSEPLQSLPRKSEIDEVIKNKEEDYEELLERLRTADSLYTEYSLEEVIYQLAKVMFTQSLTRGSAEAQQALQKFTTFLELEAERGHISRALEKKVLDVLIASLSDTLSEHPELMSAARNNLSPAATNEAGQNFIKQILELNSENKLTRDLVGYNEQNRSNEIQEQRSKLANIPLSYEKLKNV